MLNLKLLIYWPVLCCMLYDNNILTSNHGWMSQGFMSLQQYFSHFETMGGRTWKALCNEASHSNLEVHVWWKFLEVNIGSFELPAPKIWKLNWKFQEVPFCDMILSKLIDMYFSMTVLFLGHLQQNIHEFTMIAAFMGIFIILFRL